MNRRSTLGSFLFFLFSTITTQAQFGPGGIGNSADNGLWLRADALSLANGASVPTWADMSGNANNAANGVAAEQPVFNTPGTINNRPTIYFDGGDQLIVPDADILDNSAGMTYYTVLRPTGLNGAARGIVGKRITFTVAVEYAYTFFFWSANYLNLDVHTNNDRFTTNPTAYANNIDYMPGFIFDGSLPAAQRSKIYNAGTLVTQATETSTALPNSNQDLCIGALNVGYGTYYIGHMAEITHWNFALNSAQRIIVENYLGAKYNITVATDYYAYQATHAGEVAGIGRVDASNLHDDSQGSAIVRISNPSGMGDGDFLIWGHNEASMTNNNIADVDGTIIQARLNRVWRADETGDVGTVDVAFDLSNFTAYSGADLRLLIDRDGDGFFDNDVAPQSGSLVGSIITFSSVDFQAGDFFTLGSTNAAQTPLPVELLDFRAQKNNEAVDLFWTSASELNSAYYKVMKSDDGVNWNEMVTVPAAGNSNQLNNYKVADNHPIQGNNYYSLKQVDIDGSEHPHGMVSVYFNKQSLSDILVYPNPSGGTFYLSSKTDLKDAQISLFDLTGKKIPCDILIEGKEAEIKVPRPAVGLYVLSIIAGGSVQNVKIRLE